MRSPESRFERLNPRVEYEPDLELCLRVLTKEVEGKEVDAITDKYLIRQIDASKVGETPQGFVLKCLVTGCEAKCTLKKTRKGVLKLVSQSGECIREAE